MPERPTPYKLNPLPQAVIPQRSSKPAPPSGQPANLYKPRRTESQRLTPSPKPEAAPRVIRIIRATQLTETTKPRRETPCPEKIPTLTKSQQAEAQEIAHRLQKIAKSKGLDHLLISREGRWYKQLQKPQPSTELEHLAIAQRPDRRYQIVLRGTKQPVSGYAFETLEHCAEAAAELEHQFVLGPMLGAEVAEAVEGIVKAAVARERVELLCSVV